MERGRDPLRIGVTASVLPARRDAGPGRELMNFLRRRARRSRWMPLSPFPLSRCVATPRTAAPCSVCAAPATTASGIAASGAGWRCAGGSSAWPIRDTSARRGAATTTAIGNASTDDDARSAPA
jgi:hypothetical protein